jgi:hypothetical protein
LEPTLALLITALGIAGIAGGAFAVFRTKGTRDTIDLLEQSLRIERTERIADRERCNADLADLRGRVVVLTEGFAERIAVAVVDHLDRRGR